jgi:hypothetical protein
MTEQLQCPMFSKLTVIYKQTFIDRSILQLQHQLRYLAESAVAKINYNILNAIYCKFIIIAALPSLINC